MPTTSTLTEVFWVTFITTVTGMVLKLASMCYKSKCKEVSVCCIKITRDTVAEEKEEENRVQRAIEMNRGGNTESPSAAAVPSSPPSLRRLDSV